MDRIILGLALLLLCLGVTAGLSNKLAKDDLHRQRVIDFVDRFPDADRLSLDSRFTSACLFNRQTAELSAVQGYLASLGRPLEQSQPIYSHSSRIHSIKTDNISDVMLMQVSYRGGQVHYTVELVKKTDGYAVESLVVKLPSSAIGKEEATRFLGIDPRMGEEELARLLAECQRQ